ncbi:D-glucuronyl C5-epimerase family protein [Salibacterium aidingense]|uniref:D-glucuronyl C5-epimerase family protein n=1 Tax=Salibacterium aidingense TaxID=384933 RepID=UPI003BCDA2D3
MYRDITIILHELGKDTGKQIDNEIYVPYRLLENVYHSAAKWTTENKVFKISPTHADALEITNYHPGGNYLHYDKNRVENWNVVFDKNGIPKTVYPSGEFYNPSTIAHYGLQHYSLFLKNNQAENKQKFLAASEWFLLAQDNRGGWTYQFDHDFYPERVQKLKAPWYSAIGLGMAFSLLSRASYLTQNKKYTVSAIKALPLFQTPVHQNGVLAKFEDKFPFYEECPTEPPSFILNGFMFSLLGLYDLYRMTNNDDPLFLYNQGMTTLKRMLPLYDLGHRSAYDLTHYTTGHGIPNVVTWGYHITHLHLLAALYSIERATGLQEIMTRWKSYLKGQFKF